jgi:hypothetical protein
MWNLGFQAPEISMGGAGWKSVAGWQRVHSVSANSPKQPVRQGFRTCEKQLLPRSKKAIDGAHAAAPS